MLVLLLMLLSVSMVMATEKRTTTDSAISIKGVLHLPSASAWASADVTVRLFNLEDDAAPYLQDTDVFENPGCRLHTFKSLNVPPVSASSSEQLRQFVFNDLPSTGRYSIVAHSDLLQDGRYHPELHPGVGWYTSDRGSSAYSIISNTTTPSTTVDIWMDSSHEWPTKGEPLKDPTHCGVLFDTPAVQNGSSTLHVLHTKGTAKERGYAHGWLLVDQILDVFRYYVLERDIGSRLAYLTLTVPWILEKNALIVPTEYRIEMEAMLVGMKDSGHSLFVPEINREFQYVDLVALNAYLEVSWPVSYPQSDVIPNPPSCTQFSFWGKWMSSQSSSKAITGRNMDGELDLRKVTVTHLLIHAMEPTTDHGQRKVVSVMWPGFVGTLSGVDELGNSIMINAGRFSRNYLPNPVPFGTPTEWIIVDMLRNMPTDCFASPALAEQWILSRFKGASGGVSPAGGIYFVLANNNDSSPEGWVYESDRLGGSMRQENQVYPKLENVILASNHFHIYGAAHDPYSGETTTNFGQFPSFSSRYRYAVPAAKIMAWANSGVTGIEFQHVRELLQLVCDGGTEHSIIWEPSSMTLSVAAASVTADPWNAPYNQFISLPFSYFFQ